MDTLDVIGEPPGCRWAGITEAPGLQAARQGAGGWIANGSFERVELSAIYISAHLNSDATCGTPRPPLRSSQSIAAALLAERD
ncbi:hypothetical protein V2I01_13780 [Micromonospora sp. BRA006-A]|nr:hypothetical protein [Micromonospora sp. BRA006-A]